MENESTIEMFWPTRHQVEESLRRRRKEIDKTENDPETIKTTEALKQIFAKLRSTKYQHEQAESDPRLTERDGILLSQRSGSFLPSAWDIDYSEYVTVKEKAEFAWYCAFNRAPYTNFRMIDDLLKTADITYEQLFQDPAVLRKNYRNDDQRLREAAKKLDELQDTDNFGRCTSLAIEIATSLQNNAPQDFEFQYHDFTKHRNAYCKKSGICIDSSSSRGPIILVEGKWAIHDDQPGKPKWSLSGSESIFKRKNRQKQRTLKKSNILPSASESLYICLSEITRSQDLELICYFRSFVLTKKTTKHGMMLRLWKKCTELLLLLIRFILGFFTLMELHTEPGRVEYYGMILWSLKNKELRLIPNVEKMDENVVTYVWDTTGSSMDRSCCSMTLSNFIYHHGGPFGDNQWKECEGFFLRMMMAAHDVWGYPHVKGSTPGSGPQVYFKDELSGVLDEETTTRLMATGMKNKYRTWDGY